jgi:hypothetical protein
LASERRQVSLTHLFGREQLSTSSRRDWRLMSFPIELTAEPNVGAPLAVLGVAAAHPQMLHRTGGGVGFVLA